MPRAASYLLWLMPVVVSTMVFWDTRPGPFVFDEARLIRKNEAPRELSLKRSFLTDYWGTRNRVDSDYKPLTHLTYDLNFRHGDSAAAFNRVNVIFNAAVAFLVYLLLLELVAQRRRRSEIPSQTLVDEASPANAWLAALGATLFAVLPIHSQAVVEITDRGVLLAGLAIFGTWWLALKNAPPKVSGGVSGGASAARPENVGLAFAAVCGVFLGLFAHGSVILVIPLILVSCWVLGRRIPWWTLGGSMCALVGYFLVRSSVRMLSFDPVHASNPLVEADLFTRVVNGISLVALYVGKIVAPLGVEPLQLSVRYTHNALPVVPLSSPGLWASVIGVVGLLTLALWWSRKRSIPLLTLAVVFFLLTLLPVVSIFYVNDTIFSEPLAYVPSFAYALALCALLKESAVARFRGATTSVLCVLLIAYGAGTWAQNGKWAELDAATLQSQLSGVAHAWSEVNLASREALLADSAQTPEEKREMQEGAAKRIKRALEIYPDFVRGEMALGDMLYRQGGVEATKAALDRFTKAEELLAKKGRPETDHLDVWNKRGQCLLQLGHTKEAIAVFTRYIAVRRDGPIYDSRGLAFATSYVVCTKQGRPKEECVVSLNKALADFNTAVELSPRNPAHWSNRGFCKFTLGDAVGAIEDYDKGFSVCDKSGLKYRPLSQGQSQYSFLRKIADVQRSLGEAEQAARTDSAADQMKREAESADAERLPPGIGQ